MPAHVLQNDYTRAALLLTQRQNQHLFFVLGCKRPRANRSGSRAGRLQSSAEELYIIQVLSLGPLYIN